MTISALNIPMPSRLFTIPNKFFKRLTTFKRHNLLEKEPAPPPAPVLKAKPLVAPLMEEVYRPPALTKQELKLILKDEIGALKACSDFYVRMFDEEIMAKGTPYSNVLKEKSSLLGDYERLVEIAKKVFKFARGRKSEMRGSKFVYGFATALYAIAIITTALLAKHTDVPFTYLASRVLPIALVIQALMVYGILNMQVKQEKKIHPFVSKFAPMTKNKFAEEVWKCLVHNALETKEREAKTPAEPVDPIYFSLVGKPPKGLVNLPPKKA